MTSAADLRTRFGDAAFPATADTQINAAAAEADRLLNAAHFGSRSAVHADAALYLAAHIYTAGSVPSASGIASATAGPVSVTYANAATPGGLLTTAYGTHFLWLVTRAAGPAIMVI